MTASQPTLGTRIRRARERAKLSQEDLANAVGASVRAVGDWENDRRKPRNRLGAIEEVLGVDLTGEPEPEPDPITERIREAFLNAGYPPERADYLTSVVRGVADGSLTVTRRGRGPGEDQGRAAG